MSIAYALHLLLVVCKKKRKEFLINKINNIKILIKIAEEGLAIANSNTTTTLHTIFPI